MQKQNDYFQRLQAGTAIIMNARYTILLSLKRNEFFGHLEPFLAYYSNYNNRLKKQYSSNTKAMTLLNKLPDIPFEDYSISPVFLFIMLMALPVTCVIFIMQWNYIKEVKHKLKAASLIYQEIVTL